MGKTPTCHNAATLGEIAKTVLMPGDPLRAKMISEFFLESPRLYNEVRGMLGYTGTYKGKRISVQGHGMGIPSIGIYSYELYNFYEVDTIIRIGTCGALNPDVKVGTLVIADRAVTDSNYGYQYNLPKDYVAAASPDLVEAAVSTAKSLDVPCRVGLICSSDVFYNTAESNEKWRKMGVIGIEMEAHALYANAYAAGKKALTILTISDNIATGESLSSAERQTGLKNMIQVALEMA